MHYKNEKCRRHTIQGKPPRMQRSINDFSPPQNLHGVHEYICFLMQCWSDIMIQGWLPTYRSFCWEKDSPSIRFLLKRRHWWSEQSINNRLMQEYVTAQVANLWPVFFLLQAYCLWTGHVKYCWDLSCHWDNCTWIVTSERQNWTFDFNLSHILLQLLLLPPFSVCKWWWCK